MRRRASVCETRRPTANMCGFKAPRRKLPGGFESSGYRGAVARPRGKCDPTVVFDGVVVVITAAQRGSETGRPVESSLGRALREHSRKMPWVWSAP